MKANKVLPPDPLTVICAHVLSTLPEGLTNRRTVLESVSWMVKPKHPASADIRAALAALEKGRQCVARAQSQFAAMLD
jgi:hypothetical protein